MQKIHFLHSQSTSIDLNVNLKDEQIEFPCIMYIIYKTSYLHIIVFRSSFTETTESHNSPPIISDHPITEY